MYFSKVDGQDSREITMPDSFVSKQQHDFIEIIDRFINSERKILILNFSHTKKIDSAGLGFLLIARSEAHKSKRKLILKNPTNHIKKAFDIMNFYNIFVIED